MLFLDELLEFSRRTGVGESRAQRAAALRRCAETLEELRRLGAEPPPRFAIVADPSRRAEYERELRGALYARAGLPERCAFWPNTQVWVAHCWLRATQPNGPFSNAR